MKGVRQAILIAQRDLYRFWSSRYWLAGQVAMNLADIFVFALVFRGVVRRELVPDYLKFMASGVASLATFVASFSIGREVGHEVRRDVVDYLLTLPTPRWALVLGRILGGTLRGLVYQLPFLAIAAILVSPPTSAEIPYIVVTSLMLTTSMSSIAIAASTLSRDFNIQSTIRSLTYYLLFFFSNVFYPKHVLAMRFPQPLPEIINLTPISLSADIYRWCFNYYTTIEPTKMLLLALWTIPSTVAASLIYLRNLTNR